MIITINNKKVTLLLTVCLMSVGTMVSVSHEETNVPVVKAKKSSFKELEAEVKNKDIGLVADMYANKKNIVVIMDVPGVDENNIKVNVVNNHLYVSGKREEKEEVSKGKTYFSKEIKRGRFDYDIALQYSVDASAMTTELSNGVLTITLPKK